MLSANSIAAQILVNIKYLEWGKSLLHAVLLLFCYLYLNELQDVKSKKNK